MAVFVLGPGMQSWIRDWKNEILRVKKIIIINTVGEKKSCIKINIAKFSKINSIYIL